MGAEVIRAVRTDLEKRGNGVETPVRIVTQYWSEDGDLLAENDPCPDYISELSQLEARKNDIINRKQSRIDELEHAIKWAIGEEGDFVKPQGGKAFWWRASLRRRASLGGEDVQA